MQVMSLPKITIVAALLAACGSASALTLSTSALVANSVQQFSQDALDSYELFKVAITPLGNATAGTAVGSYVLPITSITMGSDLSIQGGSSVGSALEIARIKNGIKVGLTVANFTINYTTSQVLADSTPIGGTTTKQAPLYNFTRVTALSLKYKFPLSITMNETLGTLKLAPEAIEAMMTGLALPAYARPVITDIDFGTLTQDIKVAFRTKAVSTKPYVPAQ